MRLPIVLKILSRVLWGQSLLLAIVALYAVIAQETIWYAYALPAGLALLLGISAPLSTRIRRARPADLRRREGMLVVTFAWLVLALSGAVAFYLTGAFPNFAQALFESMSGYTTTGASVLGDLESLPRSIPLFRGLAHWVGGMGIIVLAVAILPELGVGGMQLFAAESSGIVSDKLAPRIRGTAGKLWMLYVGFTAIETTLLMAGGMPFYDALLHSFATVATGGFSNRSASVGAYDSVFLEVVIIVFMYLSAISFSLQYHAFVRRAWKRPIESPEVRLYTALLVGATALITWNILEAGVYDNFGQALRVAGFQVFSIGSTTGFGTADFDAWPEFSRWIFVLLMIVGGCAGSTAGGLKVVRVWVALQHARIQLAKLIRPRRVMVIEISGRQIMPDMIQGMLGFFVLYFLVAGFATLLLTGMGMQALDAFGSVISCLNSVGPGLGETGPAQNYATLVPGAHLILSACMLLGRLELLTVLVLFTPGYWRKG